MPYGLLMAELEIPRSAFVESHRAPGGAQRATMGSKEASLTEDAFVHGVFRHLPEIGRNSHSPNVEGS